MDDYYREIIEAASEMATHNEAEYHLCSQGTLAALMQAFGIHNPDVLRSSTAFAGGCVRRGDICGALAGALMFIGLLAGRDDLEMKDQAMRGMDYMDKVYKLFEEKYGTVICREIHQKLYGRIFDLTDEAQRDELHEIMVDAEEGCPDVCGVAARFAAQVAIEILETGHPFANSMVRV
ncbi:MAG: C_GCAxxG_C_C family protein [Synergistales bacterium]|nr:C_GCAxxG_C_C family protein [Synergistales bacterium]